MTIYSSSIVLTSAHLAAIFAAVCLVRNKTCVTIMKTSLFVKFLVKDGKILHSRRVVVHNLRLVILHPIKRLILTSATCMRVEC